MLSSFLISREKMNLQAIKLAAEPSAAPVAPIEGASDKDSKAFKAKASPRPPKVRFS